MWVGLSFSGRTKDQHPRCVFIVIPEGGMGLGIECKNKRLSLSMETLLLVQTRIKGMVSHLQSKPIVA